MNPARAAFAGVLALSCMACEPAQDGEGSLRFTAYGEEFIEQGIPTDAFVDGWSVQFTSFLVSLERIDVNGTALEGPFVIELAANSQGQGHELDMLSWPASEGPTVSYALGPASLDAVTDVDAQTLRQMVDAQTSIWARGEATRGDVTKRFDWPLFVEARYVNCETAVSVVDGDSTDVVLTLHADHLFYDDLDAPDPNVAFDLIAAADGDEDGEVTPSELRLQSLDGQVRYQVGGRDIGDMHAFVVAQARTLGHINGEGHCDIE